MNKKNLYIAPDIRSACFESESMIAATTTFDSEKDSQDITPVEDPFDGEFSSRRSLWDDED